METKEILIFHRDKNDRNWISRLPNGKICILHRKDPITPQENIEYKCQVDEKENYAIARINGLHAFPRAVIKKDKSCVIVEKPNDDVEHSTYSDIYQALKNFPNEFIFTICREENKTFVDKGKEDTKIVSIEIKLRIGGEDSLRARIKRKRPQSLGIKDIMNDIKKRID